MANILSKYVPGLSATAEVTGGSVDNLKLINAGKSEVGFIDGRRRLGAYKGLDKFKDRGRICPRPDKSIQATQGRTTTTAPSAVSPTRVPSSTHRSRQHRT